MELAKLYAQIGAWHPEVFQVPERRPDMGRMETGVAQDRQCTRTKSPARIHLAPWADLPFCKAFQRLLAALVASTCAIFIAKEQGCLANSESKMRESLMTSGAVNRLDHIISTRAARDSHHRIHRSIAPESDFGHEQN